MNNQSLLCELIDRVAALQGNAVLISNEELSLWEPEEVAALKSTNLLRKTRPASSIVCIGCEEECVRPVHREPEASGESRLFLVCEKRSDVNRIDIPVERLEQWQATGDSLAALIANLLRLRQIAQNETAGRWEIGLFKY